MLPFLGAAILEDTYFLVSQFAEHRDIIEYLQKEEGPALRLLYEISDAIRYLHVELRRVHCDIKPDNILVTRTRQALLCDFATVKHDGASSSANSASQRTVLYLSPECLVLKRSSEPWEGPMATLQAVIQRVCEQEKRPAPPLQPLRYPEEINAWKIAELCWEQEGARRLQASEVSGRLRGCAISANQMQ
ncbi:hypothetical protein FRC00_007332 [Tulasnella sp. 408]|nr:hypothetical protein FRC00_007332 [Tulasnella sp. 408]